MVNSTFHATSLALLLLVLGGCNVFSADSRVGAYFPLGVGHTWVYQSNYNEDGSYFERTIVVEEQLSIDGKNYFVRSTEFGRNWAKSAVLYDTVRVAHNMVLKRSGNKEVVRFNFNAGDGATYGYQVGDWNYTVTVRKGLTVEAHGREFSNCIRFFFDIPRVADDEISYTFAEGVGVVAIVGAWANLKLASFELE